MSKQIPTFRKNGSLLTGKEARMAWEAQDARCNCGSGGDAAHAISGTCKDMPAQWLGCDNCTGQAIGRPLVYRLPSQMGK